MSEYVNKTALERRRLRMLAKASESRTVNHDAIEKREARRKAQRQTNSFQKAPPKGAARSVLGDDLFSQIFK